MMARMVPPHSGKDDTRLTAEQSEVTPGDRGRPLYDMRETGVLWAINRVLFHPRGFSLALVVEPGTENVIGWLLTNHGDEIITFGPGDEDVEFAAFEAFLDSHRRYVPDE
jgi:hypothetical protein